MSNSIASLTVLEYRSTTLRLSWSHMRSWNPMCTSKCQCPLRHTSSKGPIKRSWLSKRMCHAESTTSSLRSLWTPSDMKLQGLLRSAIRASASPTCKRCSWLTRKINSNSSLGSRSPHARRVESLGKSKVTDCTLRRLPRRLQRSPPLRWLAYP